MTAQEKLERHRERVRRYRAAHPDKDRQSRLDAGRRYRANMTPEQRERHKAQSRAWYLANRELANERARERYRAANPNYVPIKRFRSHPVASEQVTSVPTWVNRRDVVTKYDLQHAPTHDFLKQVNAILQGERGLV